MPSAISSLRVTRNGIVGGGGLVVIMAPIRTLAPTSGDFRRPRQGTLPMPSSCAGNILLGSRIPFGAQASNDRDQSVVAMKSTTLSSCSFFTMRASSAFGIPVTATRTLYKPPAVGPLAIDNLLVSRNLVTSSAEACGANLMSAKVPASGAVVGADAVW